MAYGGRETPQMALDRAIGAGVVEERRDSTFYCNVCGTALKSKDTVKAHLRTKVHSENSADYDCAPRRTTVQLQNAMPREPSRKSTSVRPLQDTSKDSVTNDDLERAIKLGIVTEPLGPGDSYYCSSCEKPLKTKQTMRAHLSTSTHLSKLQNIMPREPSRKSTSVRPLQDTSKDSVTNDDLERAIKLGIVTEPLGPGDSYYCSSCEKPLKTKQTMRAHLSTSTHLSKLQNTLPREPSSKSTSVRPLQDTFKDSVTNGDLEKAIILGVVTEPKNPGDSYYCSSCKKPLKTKQTMRAHLSTPTHLSKTDVKNKDPQRAIKVSPQSFKSAGLPNQVSNSSGSDSCEGNEDERLVSKAMRDGILQEDTLSNSLTPYWCNICLQALKQYERLASHLHSKKHRAKVASQTEVTRAGIRVQAGPDSTLLCEVSSSKTRNQTSELGGEISVRLTIPEHSQQANTTTSPPSAERSNEILIKIENIKKEPFCDEKHWKAGGMEAKCEDVPEKHGENALHKDNSFPPKYPSIKKESDESAEALASCHPVNGERELAQIKPSKENEEKLVYFDLETGGLAEATDILQIAAVCNSQQFMRYVTPTKPVHFQAQRVNKLRNSNGVLEKRVSQNPQRWEKVPTQPIIHTLLEFLEWLNSIGPCYLVAHNASFDKNHLLYHVRESNLLTRLHENVLGFIDTLQFFRKEYPRLKKHPGHSLTALVKQILGETYDAHDALADAQALQRLIGSTNADRHTLLQCMLTF
ncbi:uncharacterized protein [Macrobrachium rosenbergii]|uniref:uncharacterized protein isoform X2 n=1 Tax=Macrobrachium rosenbergii TaxID=79674 RepID=UPI0034D6B2AD